MDNENFHIPGRCSGLGLPTVMLCDFVELLHVLPSHVTIYEIKKIIIYVSFVTHYFKTNEHMFDSGLGTSYYHSLLVDKKEDGVNMVRIYTNQKYFYLAKSSV